MTDQVEITEELTPKELEEAEWRICVELAAKLPFSEEGYRAHYMAILRMDMPRHVMGWVHEFFENAGRGVRKFLVKSHRGATKSTVFTVLMASYVLAKFPEWGVLIVQKSDPAGAKTATSIANIIKDNAGWKLAYPNIVPDDEKRWSENGYEIKDTSMPYDEWRQKAFRARPRGDPSFIGLGWGSSSIVGMHPMFLFIDDIHDEINTRSALEMEAVLSSLKSNILQTLNRPPGEEEPYCIVSYTPWNVRDSYAFLESTKLYYQITTPVVIPAEKNDTKGFVYRGNFVRLNWDKVKDPLKWLADKEIEYGPIDFACQMLLDLTAALGKTLKLEWLHPYRVDRLELNYPVYFGVDYASTMDKIRDKDRDYFSIAFLKLVPGFGAVVFDGYREKLSRVEAGAKLMGLAERYRPAYIGIETLGKGEEFFADMVKTELPVLPVPRRKERVLSKGEKFEGVLARLFNNSQLWIGDVETDFIKAFKNEWVSWDGTEREHDDTLDSVYIASYTMSSHLIMPKASPTVESEVENTVSPWSSLGRR